MDTRVDYGHRELGETLETLMLTVPEVAAHLRIGRTVVFRLIKSGDLPSVRIGRARRVSREALVGFIASRGLAP